jgi:hypothetical protein
MTISRADERRVRAAATAARAAVLALPSEGGITDVALIGNASEVYEWVPSRIVDLDCFVFVREMNAEAGIVLQNLRSELGRGLKSLGVDFELRIIRGMYKPDRGASDPPIVLLHLGAFTDETYLAESIVKRWAWRKYRCQVEGSRLARLAPRRPVLDDLLYGPGGVIDRLHDLHRGETVMSEWSIPELSVSTVSFDADSWVFTEFCYGSAATTARTHARVLGHGEADRLGNEEFFAWYDQNVLATRTLLPLMAMKGRARNEGFSAGASRPRELCTEFLERVLACGAGIRPGPARPGSAQVTVIRLSRAQPHPPCPSAFHGAVSPSSRPPSFTAGEMVRNITKPSKGARTVSSVSPPSMLLTVPSTAPSVT